MKKKYMNVISNNIARSKYNKGKLGSRGEIIEIDESYFMKRKYGKGRLKKGHGYLVQQREMEKKK